jgi:hypothetical protein
MVLGDNFLSNQHSANEIMKKKKKKKRRILRSRLLFTNRLLLQLNVLPIQTLYNIWQISINIIL